MHVLFLHRLTVEVTLNEVAAASMEKIALGLRLNPLGNNLQTKVVRHRNNGPNQEGIADISFNVLDEGVIDF